MNTRVYAESSGWILIFTKATSMTQFQLKLSCKASQTNDLHFPVFIIIPKMWKKFKNGIYNIASLSSNKKLDQKQRFRKSRKAPRKALKIKHN